MSLNFGHTCPEIDRNINEVKKLLQSYFEDAVGESTVENIKEIAEGYTEYCYDDIENIFEDVRKTNEEMRYQADEQIKDLEDEIADLKSELEALESKIETLEGELQTWN